MNKKSIHPALAVLSQWYPSSTEQELTHEVANLAAFLEGSYPELNHEEVASVAIAVLAILHAVKLRPPITANAPS
jgi:hypothetical protein